MSNILKGLNESLSTLSPEQVEQFKKQLEIAKQGFDPNYQYSDDYSFWKKQNDKAQTISRLTKILNTAGVELQEEGVAEESDKQFAQRMKKKAAQPPTKGMSQKEKEDKGWAKPKEQGVAEGKQPGKPVVDVILKVMPVAQEIWFHGSRATGQHRKNSDTDILVVIPDDLVGDQYLSVVRILQKLSSHFDNYDIQPTKAGTNIHRIAQEEGRLLWSSKQGVAEGQLDELSPQTLASYKKKAGADATAADKRGDYKRGDKRMSGIIKATKKEFDNDSKGVKEGYRYDSGDYSNARMGREYGKKNLSVDSGAYEFEKEVHRNEPGGEHGRPKSLKGVSKSLPADAFGRTTGEIPAGKTGRIHSMMRDPDDELDEACWKGYHKEGNKKMFGKTYPNCVKNEGVAEEKCPHCGGELVSEELMNEKKDACYYKVKSRYKVWPSAYASGALVKCRKSHGNWGNGGKKNESSILEGIERADENLHQWFKEKWVRFGPDGKIRGACARGDDSEGKPKCLPQSKAQSLGKKGRASAAARKRREDPNPDRSGPAINVNTKKKSNESVLDEKWSQKYKDSINCSNPKGFSQKAHCAGKKK